MATIARQASGRRADSLPRVPVASGPLRLFVAHPSALLTDHRSHGDGLIALSFLRHLAERGHEIDVAVQEVDVRRPLPANLRPHAIMGPGELSAARRLVYALRVRRLYDRLTRERRFDLIHQFNPVDVGLTTLLPHRSIPVVLGPYPGPWPRQSTGVARLPSQALRASLQWLQQRRAQAILVFVAAGAANVRPRRARARITVVAPGVDLAAFHPPAKEAFSRPRSVLYVGGLQPRKGVLELIEAFGTVAAKLDDVQLRVAGHGSLEAEARRLSAAAGLAKRITFLGQVEHQRVPDLMRSSSLFCLPSRGEPFGMSALEALASGLPLVVTNTGGLGEWVPEHAGRMVPPGDPGALAQALLELLELPVEPLTQMRRANRRAAESYSWPAAVDRLEEVYARLLNAPEQR